MIEASCGAALLVASIGHYGPRTGLQNPGLICRLVFSRSRFHHWPVAKLQRGLVRFVRNFERNPVTVERVGRKAAGEREFASFVRRESERHLVIAHALHMIWH